MFFDWLRSICFRFGWYRLALHILNFYEKYGKYFPKIPVPKPKPPMQTCPDCGSGIIMVAVDTGDGWVFEWSCENYCDIYEYYEDSSVDQYFPYLFGWATPDDLSRMGIDIV